MRKLLSQFPFQTANKTNTSKINSGVYHQSTPKDFVVGIKAAVVTNGVSVVSTTAVGSIVAVIAKITILVCDYANHGHNIQQKLDERKACFYTYRIPKSASGKLIVFSFKSQFTQFQHG